MADSADHQALEDFRAKLDECTKPAMCGRSFVLTKRLHSWLRSQSSHGVTNLQRLLASVHHLKPSSPPGFAFAEQTISNRKRACILLSILLDMNEADHFEALVSANFQVQLPRDLDSLKKEFRTMRIQNSGSFAERFDAHQWKFFPVKLRWGDYTIFKPTEIIPIISKQQLNKKKRGMASLWLIELFEESVEADLLDHVPHCVSNDSNDDLGPRYKFALKSYSQGSKKYFDNERVAFNGLRKQGGMVKCLCTYSHEERTIGRDLLAPSSILSQADDNLPTHNILLEYGSMDLDVYFANHHPPFLEKEISGFWEGLIGIAKALKRIHDFESPDDKRKFNGWHADIKPDNIIVIDGKLKLADPGFAKFIEKAEGDETYIEGATWVYSAPEHQPNSNQRSKVTQKIDIWSLGCVFSIAATWVAGGYSAVRDFNKIRGNAIKSIIENKASGENLPAQAPGPFFHDGKKVLDVVTEWHKVLRSAIRQSDTLTNRILDLVDNHMLTAKPQERISAGTLCDRLDFLTKEYKEKTHSDPSSCITEALLQTEEEASKSYSGTDVVSSVLVRDSSGTVDERKAEKERILDQPMKKTAYRAEYLNTVRSGSPSREKPRIDTTGAHRRNTVGRRTSFGALTGTPTTVRHDTEAEPLPRSKAPHVAQNVFQALNELEHYYKGIIKHLGPTLHHNEKLKGYFKNRDIWFLVDNGSTMADHWDQAQFVMKALAMKGQALDKDGMDLTFTRGRVEVRGTRLYLDIVKAMGKEEVRPSEYNLTDMKSALGDIFQEQITRLKRIQTEISESRRPRSKGDHREKNLTLIILTDGIWSGTVDKSGLKQKIADFVKEVEGLLGQRERPVSIQFVQFGRNPDATFMLRSLDDSLKWEVGIPDVIDVEHADGDVNKMLIGSFNENYDRIAHDELYSSLSLATTDSNLDRNISLTMR